MKPDTAYVTIRLRRDELGSLLNAWTGDGWEGKPMSADWIMPAARATVRLCAAYFEKPPTVLVHYEQRVPDWAFSALALSTFANQPEPAAESKALKAARAAGARDGRKLVATARGRNLSPEGRKRIAATARRTAKRRARGPNGAFATTIAPQNTLEGAADARD